MKPFFTRQGKGWLQSYYVVEKYVGNSTDKPHEVHVVANFNEYVGSSTDMPHEVHVVANFNEYVGNSRHAPRGTCSCYF